MSLQQNIPFPDLDIIPNGGKKFIDKPSGKELAREGMERAVNKAEKENPGWKEKAFNFFVEFARNSKEPFMTNDVVQASLNILPQPTKLQSWGSIATKVKNAGITKWMGYAPGKKPEHHGNPRSVWEYTGKEI